MVRKLTEEERVKRLPEIKELRRQWSIKNRAGIRARHKERLQNDPAYAERHFARAKAYREKNRERLKEENRLRHQRDREKRRQQWKERYPLIKEQAAARSRKHYLLNREHRLRRSREYRIANPERVKASNLASSKRAYVKYPHRVAARTFVGNAIKAGLVQHAPCVVCGNPEADAHHNSYKREDWLNVVWYCRLHHYAWHRLFVAEE